MLTQENIKALKLWQAAEGKASHGYKSQREAQYLLAESIASGEFPTQILPAVRRTVTEVYERTERIHDQFTTRKTVQAINVEEDVNVFTFDGQDNIPDVNAGDRFVKGGLPTILPREKYPQIGMTASGKKIIARKIGEAFGLDWEAVVRARGANVNVIRSAFEAFGRHAGNQEDIDVALQLVTPTGFNTDTLADALAVSGNPDLNTDPETLSNVVAELLERPVEGVIPGYTSYALLTAPSNVAAAQRALQQRTITRVPARTGTDSATAGLEFTETIPVGAQVDVIGWRWLQRIFPDMGRGWMLVPKASDDDLPVLTSNYLEGYETPSVWIKDSNARQVGGGAVNALTDGDFDSDAVETKVRHVHGANLLWGAGIAYSLGTNV